jgi:putative transposase
VRSTTGPQWDLLSAQDELSVADGTARVRQVEYHLCLFSGLATYRVWTRLMEILRQCERRRQGRQAEPSAGSVDSQSIKTDTQATEVGFDGGKQGKGRKRPLLVDTLGLLIAVVVTAGNTDDRVGLMLLLTQYFVAGVRRLRKLWLDGSSQAEWLTQW